MVVFWRKDKQSKVQFGVTDQKLETDRKAGEFEFDPLNPFQQLVGIFIGGFLASMFIFNNSLSRWIFWGVGVAVWGWYHFIAKNYEGAVKK